MEQESCGRNHEGGIIKEEHGGGIMEVETFRKPGGGNMEEEEPGGQEQPGAARSSQDQPGTARTARGSHEQPVDILGAEAEIQHVGMLGTNNGGCNQTAYASGYYSF